MVDARWRAINRLRVKSQGGTGRRSNQPSACPVVVLCSYVLFIYGPAGPYVSGTPFITHLTPFERHRSRSIKNRTVARASLEFRPVVIRRSRCQPLAGATCVACAREHRIVARQHPTMPVVVMTSDVAVMTSPRGRCARVLVAYWTYPTEMVDVLPNHSSALQPSSVWLAVPGLQVTRSFSSHSSAPSVMSTETPYSRKALV